MKKKTFLFAVLITLISCKKNNDSIHIEGQYKSSTTGSVSPVMMYTKQGQVTNSATIQDFLERKGFLDGFILNSSSTPIPANLLTLTITQNNMATILTSFSPTLLHSEIVSHTPSELVIAEMDSVQILIPSGVININLGRCDTLTRAIKNINPTKKYYPLSSSTGYSGYYKFRPMFPIEIKNGQLLLPLMRYVVRSGNCFLRSSPVRDEWNSFNSNIIGQLQTGDTIVYQINKVQLLKQ